MVEEEPSTHQHSAAELERQQCRPGQRPHRCDRYDRHRTTTTLLGVPLSPVAARSIGRRLILRWAEAAVGREGLSPPYRCNIYEAVSKPLLQI